MVQLLTRGGGGGKRGRGERERERKREMGRGRKSREGGERRVVMGGQCKDAGVRDKEVCVTVNTLTSLSS